MSEATMAYPTEPIVNKGELPDLFSGEDGGRVATPAAWAVRSRAWRDLVVATEYGGMPPAPAAVEVETLCESGVQRWEETPRLWSLRIHVPGGEKPFMFTMRLLLPAGDGPFPVIVNGDGCWWYVNEEVARKVLQQGCGLAMFNRTEMAADLGVGGKPNPRTGGLYGCYPGQTFGALAAWAWGYHRCVDALRQIPLVDAEHLAVTGHSRGGKATLLAGATDERIALVNDNASGAGGSAAFRYVGDGGETLNIVNVFPSWFGPGLRDYVGREEALPFDQHALVAAVAPRPLLLTYALDDRWSNPEGMVQCVEAAREAYRFLGGPDRLAYHLRPGGHAHALRDWEVLLDFIAWQWQGDAPTAPYNRHPYGHLKPAHTWSAPAG